MFENPFQSESKKAKKSLLKKGLRFSIEKDDPDLAKKIKAIIERDQELVDYGELKILRLQVEFLHDLEDQLIEHSKKMGYFSTNPMDRKRACSIICDIGRLDESCIDEDGNITKLNLGELSIIFNLPESISQLKHLRTLQLAYCELTHLPDSIYKLKELKELSLEYNKLDQTTIDRVLKIFPFAGIYPTAN